MLDMPSMNHLGSFAEELELLNGGGSLQTSGLENLQKASDDFLSQ